MDGPASSCLDLMKTVGAFGVLVGLEHSEAPKDVPDSPPCISSLWLGLDLVMGLTALLYMIFCSILSRSLKSLHLHNVLQILTKKLPFLQFLMGSVGHV